ncbi:MAG: cache domain-containing protein [Planctomycetes bacterium]|nr:cache domain-containing protein [Planctomycetota bacterium]
MLLSQKMRIFAVVAGITFLTTGVLMIAVQWQAQKTLKEIQERDSHYLLDAVTKAVENQHQSIIFYRDKLIEHRKKELRDIVDIAFDTLENNRQLAGKNGFSLEDVKRMSIDQMRAMRYASGVGYFWINDTTRPYPIMIMHPTEPELDGKVLNNPSFNCALGNDTNLFQAGNEFCARDGSGYIDYLWPKPTEHGLSDRQPKLSYVRLYKPWNWIIGSGVYMDDVEKDVDTRIAAVLDELRATFKDKPVNEGGYMFFFSGDKKMLIHPVLEGENVATLKNPVTGQFILDEMKLAAETDNKLFTYLWDRPDYNKSKTFRKRAYISHYKPLDWYICVTYYDDDIERPAWDLAVRMFGISLILLALSLIFSSILSESLSSPLRKLASAAERISKDGPAGVDIPITGSLETRELGQVMSDAFDTIRRTETSLRESEENLRITLDSIGDAVIATDIDGRIVRMNHVAEELTAWPFEQAKGRVLFDGVMLMDPETGAPMDNPVNYVLNRDKRYYMKTHAVMVTHDNSRCLIADSCSPIHNSEDELVGVVMVFRDVTDKIRLEEDLRQTQKMDSLGLLAGGIAHDFNNMLAGIMASAEIVATKIPDVDPKITKYINLIIESSEKAADLTGKLLAFSRKGKLFSTPIDVHASIRDAIAILERSIDKRVDVIERLDAESSTIIGDPSQIQNMVLNLGVNAAHAMSNGGFLAISTHNTLLDADFCESSTFEIEPGEYIELCVEDTGLGISREDLHKIFEPFYTTKDVGQGTGLGLAAVYGTVKDHHGAIVVESELNHGTQFHIYLPVSKSSMVVQHPAPEPLTPMQGKGCILVVDDESVIRTATENSLTDMGYTVLLACDGVEALSIYEKKKDKIDLVILDMIMPKMNGPDCFRAIRKVNPDAKILIASGFAKDGDIANLKKEGLLGFIKKPYRRSLLSQLLSELL